MHPFISLLNPFMRHIQSSPLLIMFLMGCISGFAFWNIPLIRNIPFILIWMGVWGFLNNFHENESLKIRLLKSLSWSMGHFGITMYWTGYALKTAGLSYIAPFATLGMVLAHCAFSVTALSVFMPLILKNIDYIPHDRLRKSISFAIVWVVFEYLRSYIFPWNLWGYAVPLEMLQSVNLIGIHGLSFLIIMVGLSVFYVRCKMLSMGMIIMTVGLYIYGSIQLHQDPGKHPINGRIIQSCLDQKRKWETLDANIEKQLALSFYEAERPLDFIVWPESSVTTLVHRHSAILKRFVNVAPIHGHFLFGAPRYDEQHNRDSYYVSLFALNNNGDIKGIYDKKILVPFGEYSPFPKWMNIRKMTYGSDDFSMGITPSIMRLNGLPPFVPLICYESIFPINHSGDAEWILNITNDAWFEESMEPYQHLMLSRVRAIEEGMPFVRVANNGISAIINARGKIIHQLPTNAVGFIDFELPKSLKTHTPLGIKNGTFIVIMMMGFWIISIFITHRRRRNI
jgi:apolipoprotein N-acyltransferase